MKIKACSIRLAAPIYVTVGNDLSALSMGYEILRGRVA
jgi:hypothetical protein